MNIVAVVVTYNRKVLLKECIDAILSQSLMPSKVIIIDNASTDGTKNMLEECGYLSMEIFDYRLMESNLGGAGGFYKGINISKEYDADWVWIMDDDTIPDEGALYALTAGIKNAPDSSFFASCVRGPSGEPMNVPVLDTKGSDNGYMDWYFQLSMKMVKIQMATFVSILISGEAIKKCGLPCKEFFIWGDDSEYTLRLTRYYGNAYLVGDSWVCHKRFNAKKLGIQFEEDKNRIKNYHYLYRNHLIRLKIYDRFDSFFLRFLKYECLSVFVIFKCKNGLKRFAAVQKGILEFVFQHRKFKTIIKNNVSE